MVAVEWPPVEEESGRTQSAVVGGATVAAVRPEAGSAAVALPSSLPAKISPFQAMACHPQMESLVPPPLMAGAGAVAAVVAELGPPPGPKLCFLRSRRRRSHFGSLCLIWAHLQCLKCRKLELFVGARSSQRQACGISLGLGLSHLWPLLTDL